MTEGMATMPGQELTDQWYWCLDHQRVEQGPGCPNDRRLGPYDTRAGAENALALARERTEAWDAAESEWDDAD